MQRVISSRLFLRSRVNEYQSGRALSGSFLEFKSGMMAKYIFNLFRKVAAGSLFKLNIPTGPRKSSSPRKTAKL